MTARPLVLKALDNRQSLSQKLTWITEEGSSLKAYN